MERRQHNRLPSDQFAVCRVPASPHRACLLDVSASGCRVKLVDGMAVPIGSTIHIDFGPGRQVSGLVMWSDPPSAGVRFDRELPDAVAVMLGLQEAAVEIAPPEPEPYPVGGSPLRHWVRRLMGRAA